MTHPFDKPYSETCYAYYDKPIASVIEQDGGDAYLAVMVSESECEAHGEWVSWWVYVKIDTENSHGREVRELMLTGKPVYRVAIGEVYGKILSVVEIDNSDLTEDYLPSALVEFKLL